MSLCDSIQRISYSVKGMKIRFSKMQMIIALTLLSSCLAYPVGLWNSGLGFNGIYGPASGYASWSGVPGVGYSAAWNGGLYGPGYSTWAYPGDLGYNSGWDNWGLANVGIGNSGFGNVGIGNSGILNGVGLYRRDMQDQVVDGSQVENEAAEGTQQRGEVDVIIVGSRDRSQASGGRLRGTQRGQFQGPQGGQIQGVQGGQFANPNGQMSGQFSNGQFVSQGFQGSGASSCGAQQNGAGRDVSQGFSHHTS